MCVVAQTDTSTEVRVTAELLGRGRRLCSVVPVFLENGSCLCVCVYWTQHPNRKRSPHEDVGMTLTTRQLEITVHQDPNIFGGQKNRQQRWKKKGFWAATRCANTKLSVASLSRSGPRTEMSRVAIERCSCVG